MVIMGIDPGSRFTGYGLIRVDGSRYDYISSGCINCKKLDFNQRLKQIFIGITEVISVYQPDVVAIEQIFMHKFVDAALKLGHARGAAIAAVMQHDVNLFEYSARQIKQAVVGYGAASKTQMQHMVVTLLQLQGVPQEDAADALSAALCCAHRQQNQLISEE